MEELVSHPAVESGETVLDFGCGESPYEEILFRKFKRYLRADLPDNPRAEVALDASGRLPLPNGSVDSVVSTQVLEHVRDPHAYLCEARRVLSERGTLLLSTHGAWPYHPDPTDYWRWTREGLELELRCAGFSPIVVRGVLGATATALQLLQDATSSALPRLLRPVPGVLFQRAIGAIERRRADPAPPNAAVYVVLAVRDAAEAARDRPSQTRGDLRDHMCNESDE